MNKSNHYESNVKPRLEKIAYQISKPFCYSCYIEAPTGTCPECFSDDLMRIVSGEGCEYNIDWVVALIITSNLTPIKIDKMFEETIRDCYPEITQMGWLEVDTVEAIKTTISWGIAKNEYLTNEEDEGNLITYNRGTYSIHDIERFLDESELETKLSS